MEIIIKRAIAVGLAVLLVVQGNGGFITAVYADQDDKFINKEIWTENKEYEHYEEDEYYVATDSNTILEPTYATPSQLKLKQTADNTYTDQYGTWTYVKDFSDTWKIVTYDGTASNIVIPETIEGQEITVIAPYVFQNNTNIETVYTSNVTDIMGRAFQGCTNLADADMPNVKRIYGGAFKDCTSLTKISIPKLEHTSQWTSSATEATRVAPFHNVKLTDMIGDQEFPNLQDDEGILLSAFTEARSISLPDFTGTLLATPKNLVSISAPKVTQIEGALSNSPYLENIDMPAVTTIGTAYTTLINCPSLKQVYFPELVTLGGIAESVGAGGFYNCGIESADFPKLRGYVNGFTVCPNLKSLNLPEGVEYWGGYDLGIDAVIVNEAWSGIEKLVLPESLTVLGANALAGSIKLREITIPKNVTQIDENALSGCPSLESINFQQPRGQITTEPKTWGIDESSVLSAVFRELRSDWYRFDREIDVTWTAGQDKIYHGNYESISESNKRIPLTGFKFKNASVSCSLSKKSINVGSEWFAYEPSSGSTDFQARKNDMYYVLEIIGDSSIAELEERSEESPSLDVTTIKLKKAGTVNIRATAIASPDQFETTMTLVITDDDSGSNSGSSSGGNGSSGGNSNSSSSGNSNSSSSNSGGGSGSGGGSRSSGGGTSGGSAVTAGPGATGQQNLPSYVIKGTWNFGEDGNWRFSDSANIAYNNLWAAIYNPYANTAVGAQNYDWFRFDENGIMISGWWTDPIDGNVYYLSPLSDGTKGHMVIGWVTIDGKEYYFNPNSDGSKGRLLRNESTGDGHFVGADGVKVY